MKRFFLTALVAFVTVASASAQYSIKTPILAQDASLSGIMAYVAELEQLKDQADKVARNGREAINVFLQEQSPEIYSSVVKSVHTGKTISIIGGSIAVAGIGGAIGTLAAYNFNVRETIPGSLIAGSCGALAAVGLGMGLAGIITILDSGRDGIVLYKRAVNDEITRIKSFSGYRAELHFGATASGVGLALNF